MHESPRRTLGKPCHVIAVHNRRSRTSTGCVSLQMTVWKRSNGTLKDYSAGRMSPCSGYLLQQTNSTLSTTTKNPYSVSVSSNWRYRCVIFRHEAALGATV